MVPLTIKTWHDREHYDYQRIIIEAIINALFDSREGTKVRIPIEISRQSGKTTTIVDVVEILLAFYHKLFNRPLRVGIFAPEREQAATDFERLKMQLVEAGKWGFATRTQTKGLLDIPEKWNSKSIRLYKKNGYYLGEVYIFPISKHSNPESKTLDLIIIEEAQKVDDERVKNGILPMGASTNAPVVFVGTAGYRVCMFKRELESNPRAIRIGLDKIFSDRAKEAEVSGDPAHLLYQKFVESEIADEGEDSPYIKTQYKGIWVIGSGNFTTAEKLDAMIKEGQGIILENKERPVLDEQGNQKLTRDKKPIILEPLPCYFGLDTAKHMDRTICTVIRDHPDNETNGTNRSQLCGWLVLKGDNYEDQFDYIMNFLANFKNLRGGAIDATGQGDFMPDKFERHSNYNIIRFKFSPESKDVGYKILLQVIENKLTDLPNIPSDKDYLRFRQEMLDLQREQKGRFMSVHHPESGDMHDDHPDSWMLAEYAKTESIKHTPNIRFL